MTELRFHTGQKWQHVIKRIINKNKGKLNNNSLAVITLCASTTKYGSISMDNKCTSTEKEMDINLSYSLIIKLCNTFLYLSLVCPWILWICLMFPDIFPNIKDTMCNIPSKLDVTKFSSSRWEMQVWLLCACLETTFSVNGTS